jgi:hypothetical protein
VKAVVRTVVVLGAGAFVAREVMRRSSASRAAKATNGKVANRWRAVTINRTPDEVAPDGKLPEPLTQLEDRIEVRVRPAAAGKGTELAVRLRQPERSALSSMVQRISGEDPRQQVRAALRDAKQLIEVGEVLRVDPMPHGKRTSTPTGKLLELVTRRAEGEGIA